MKLKQLLQGADFEGIVGGDVNVIGLAYDSRKVQKGYAFFCIEGNATDGHNYVDDAIRNGAIAIVAQREIKADVPVARVGNTRRALSYASAHFFGDPSRHMDMVGVTGTNGKTTTTYMMKAIFDAAGSKTGLIGTIACYAGDEKVGASLTTPEPLELHQMLARMEEQGCRNVVMEVSSHALAQKRVSSIQYRVGAFTNLTQDHLDYHGSMEAYAGMKKKLFRRCEIGMFNLDDPMGAYMAEGEKCEKLFYAVDDIKADIRAQDVQTSASGIAYTMVTPKGNVDIKLSIPGKFTVYNSLCAAACCYAMGVSLEDIASGLAGMQGVPGRIQLISPAGMDFAVILDYAHTPDGLRNILSSVRDFTDGRVITVFGCGGDRDFDKRPKMGLAAGEGSDYCVVTSDNPRTEAPMEIIEQILPGVLESSCEFEVEENRREAIAKAMHMAKKGDTVVLAGKGHEPYQEIDGVRHDFDEKQIVLDVYKKMQ